MAGEGVDHEPPHLRIGPGLAGNAVVLGVLQQSVVHAFTRRVSINMREKCSDSGNLCCSDELPLEGMACYAFMLFLEVQNYKL